MLAATGGHAEMLTLLLAWGADVNLKARSGATALTSAQGGGHAGVEELLRAVGAKE
jgi:ankyrin repeat protein